MNAKPLILLPILILVLFFVACGSISDPDNDPGLVCLNSGNIEELMPLEVGNYWQYLVENDFGSSTDTLTVSVLSKWEEKSSSRYETQYKFASSQEVAITRIWSTMDGDAILVGNIVGTDTTLAEVVRLPLRPALGDEFYWYNWVRDASGDLHVADSTQYTVSALSHRFQLDSLSYPAISFSYKHWIVPDANPDDGVLHFAPGIGFVGSEQRLMSSLPSYPPRQRLTLKKWCVLEYESSN